MENVDLDVMRKLSYGLFVLTSRDSQKDNGCIVNVSAQLTSTPLRIMIAVNKGNLTHDLIMESNLFNLNVLTEATPMEVLKHFGFQSGKLMDKFKSFSDCERSKNGLLYLNRYSCGFMSGTVVQKVDLVTHTMFIADVSEARVLSEESPLTYTYYHKYTKLGVSPSVATPAAEMAETPRKGKWVCEICGYEYEGDEVPDDFVCPICSHGKEAFTLQG